MSAGEFTQQRIGLADAYGTTASVSREPFTDSPDPHRRLPLLLGDLSSSGWGGGLGAG